MSDGRAGGKELSVFDLACVVIGGIIGVGIFFTPGTVASRVGSANEVLLAWGIGGVLAALGAFVFAELAARQPGHGGIVRYIHAAFGPLPAFLYGWANWLVIQSGALAVVGLICIEHVERAIWGHAAAPSHLRVWCAAAMILLLMATNLRGLRVGKQVQNALIVTKIAALLVLVAAALFVAGGGAPPAAAAGVAADAAPLADSLVGRMLAAMLPVLFAIGGWQQGSFLAGAARRPQRDVPLGILLGVAVVIAVYMAINKAYIDVLGFDGAARTRTIGADAAAAVFGSSGERVFAAMVALSAAGIMNTICMAPPYVLLTMAEEGLFPRAFAKRHPVHGTPTIGVLGQGLWATMLLLVVHGIAVFTAEDGAAAGKATMATLDYVCDGVVFVDWLFFMGCGLALLRLRRDGTRAPFQSRGGPLVPLLFAGGALAVTIGAIQYRMAPSLTGAAIALLGLPVYLWQRRRAA